MFFSPVAILDHLKIYLPRITDLFSTNTDVSAEIIDGDPQILRITKTAHGLAAGQEIITVNGLIDNSIISVSDAGDVGTDKILRFTTLKDHDLTFGDDLFIQLDGFTDSGLNGTFSLYSVASRKIFEIVYSSIPTLNGNEVLREEWENGINGKFEISSITSNTFDIELTNKPEYTPGQVQNLQIVESFRMSIVADFNRAEQLYTESATDKHWLFVIMNSAATSKDRTIESDAISTSTAQNPQRLKIINTFFINIILNTTNDLAAANASQAAWSDIMIYLLSALSGITFETFGNSNYVTTMIDHAQIEYNNAYYGHSYQFEYVYEITDVDNFTQQFIVSRSFRDDFLSFQELQDGSNINLDDES